MFVSRKQENKHRRGPVAGREGVVSAPRVVPKPCCLGKVARYPVRVVVANVGWEKHPAVTVTPQENKHRRASSLDEKVLFRPLELFRSRACPGKVARYPVRVVVGQCG